MARFLLISHIFPPAIDGGSRVVNKMGDYLEKLGHTTLYLSSNCYSTDDFTHSTNKHTPNGLPVYTIFHKILKHTIPVLSKGPIFKLMPFLKFSYQVIRFKPQFIIAGPLPTTVIIYAKFFQILTGAKLIINASFHPTDPDFHQPLLVKILKSSDFIWTLTRYESNYLTSKFTISSKKILLLGNGVDPSFIKKLKKVIPNTPTLLFIGSLAAHKDIPTLISAHQLLLTKYPNLKLIIAGQTTLYYPKISPLLSLPNIKLYPNPSNASLKKLYDQATIFISPSTQESFGLVLIEAMARKTPVITADIPQSNEIINRTRGGITFHRQNPSHLATKINYLLTHPKTYQKLSQSGFNYVTKFFAWDKIVKDLCQNLSF